MRPLFLTPRWSCAREQMLVTIPTFRSKPAGMDRDSTIRPIVRKTVALSKSLGPICDLVSTGAVAIYVVGVFFGVGFYLLMLKDTEGSRFGTGSDHLSKSLTETSHAFHSMIGPDRLIIQLPKVASDKGLTVAPPDEKAMVDKDRPAKAPAVVDPSSTELGRPLSGDLGITPRVYGELAPARPAPSQSRGGNGARSAAQVLRASSPGKSQHARATNIRPARSYIK